MVRLGMGRLQDGETGRLGATGCPLPVSPSPRLSISHPPIGPYAQTATCNQSLPPAKAQ